MKTWRFILSGVCCLALSSRLWSSPTAATFCIAQDDSADVWINGVSLGNFPYISGPACLTGLAGIMNGSGSNTIAVKLKNVSAGQVFVSWTLDVQDTNGTHTYVNSNTNVPGILFYNTPSNPGATQPPGSGGNGNFWDPAWTPSGWGAPVLDTGPNNHVTLNDAQTGVTLTPLSFVSDGSSNDTSQYLWFRQDFVISNDTPTPSPSVTPTLTPYPPGCGIPVTDSATVAINGNGASPNGNNQPTASFTNFTVPSGVPNGLLLVQLETQVSGFPSTTVSFDGQALTLLRTDATNNSSNISTYYLLNPLPGTGPLVFSFTPNSSNQAWGVSAVLYQGVDQTTPFGASAVVQTTAISHSVSLTTTGSASTIRDFITVDNSVTLNAMGAGQVNSGLGQNGSGVHTFAVTKDVGGPGPQSLSFTWGQSKNFTHQLIEIRGPSTCGTPTFTQTLASTFTSTVTPSPSPSNTPSATQSDTPSVTPSSSPSATASDSPSVTPSGTSTATPSASPSVTPSGTATSTASVTPSATQSATPSASATVTLQVSPTNTATASATSSATPTASDSPSPSDTPTASPSASVTPSFSSTASATMTPSNSPTPSFSPTASDTPVPTFSFTVSMTYTQTPVPLAMPFKTDIKIYNSAGEAIYVLFDGAGQSQAGGFSLSNSALLPGSGGVTLNLSGLIQGGATTLVWQGQNGSGQSVAAGVYYIKMEQVDSFGSVQSWTKAIAVMPSQQRQSLNIYNSAGELVTQLDPAALGVSSTLTQVGFANQGKPVYVVQPGLSNPGGVSLVVSGSQGSIPFTWNGRNSSGQLVSSGSYIVQLVSEGSGSRAVVDSKSFVLLVGPDTLGTPKVMVVPNPLGPQDKTLTFVYGSLPPGDDATVKLYNLAGDWVAQGSAAPGATRLDIQVGHWSYGIYVAVFEVHDAGALRSRQLVKVALRR